VESYYLSRSDTSLFFLALRVCGIHFIIVHAAGCAAAANHPSPSRTPMQQWRNMMIATEALPYAQHPATDLQLCFQHAREEPEADAIKQT
jgi:hypothetical protein